MSNEERQKRIKVLQRQEDRIKRLPQLLEALTEIAGHDIPDQDILSLEQIDQHQMEINRSDFQFNYLNLSFPETKFNELSALMYTALGEQLNKRNYLSLLDFADIAVLQMNTDFVVPHLQDIITLKNNIVRVFDSEYKNGLWIDLFQEYWYLDNRVQFIWIYELRVFGKEWIKLVNDQL